LLGTIEQEGRERITYLEEIVISCLKVKDEAGAKNYWRKLLKEAIPTDKFLKQLGNFGDKKVSGWGGVGMCEKKLTKSKSSSLVCSSSTSSSNENCPLHHPSTARLSASMAATGGVPSQSS